MTALHIRLLGETRAYLSQEEALQFPTRKSQALLVYLACPPGRAVTREHLAGLLWSRNTEEQARTNLRQNLSRLKKVLVSDQEMLKAAAHEIALDARLVTTDLMSFEALAQSGDPAVWGEAAALLKGEFAAGYSLNEPAFDDWIAGERRRVANSAVSLLTRLLAHQEEADDHDAVAETARRLLIFDPLNEGAHQSVMRALAKQDRFETALQQYKICRDTLRKELGVPPSEETRRLYEDITRSREVSRRAADAPAVESDGLMAALGGPRSDPRALPENLPPQLAGLNLRPPERPSIVILPFSNLTGDSDRDHLAEGIRIDLQAALVKMTGIFLIAAGSANALRGHDARVAGQVLGVKCALQGSIRQAGGMLRISVELIGIESGEAIWTETYDRQFDDGFAVQDEIVAEVIKALDVKLIRGEDAAVWHKTLKNRKALESFYKGVQEFFKVQKDSMVRARRLFEAVDRMEPTASTGATWVALCHWFDAFKGWHDDFGESLRMAENWAEKAVGMEDPDGQAHMVLSHVHLMNRRYDEALIVGREAVQLRPNCTNANGFFANVLHFCGEQRDAIDHVTWAIRYSPVYPPFFADVLSLAYLFDGASDHAMAVAQESLRLSPQGQVARLVLAAAKADKADDPGAHRWAEEILSSDPGFSLERFASLQPYREPGDLDAFVGKLKSAGLPG